jgi:cell surface protein SprA
MFDWNYRVNYNLTKSLQFSFNATNNRLIRNYIRDGNIADNTVSIWDDFFEIGDPNQHFQSLQLNYELPFDKLPILRFIKATYSYTGDFQWQRGSEVFRNLEGVPDLGNSVQNSSVHQINANLDMNNLYQYLKLTPRRSTPATVQQRSAAVPTLDGNQAQKPANDQRLSPETKHIIL